MLMLARVIHVHWSIFSTIYTEPLGTTFLLLAVCVYARLGQRRGDCLPVSKLPRLSRGWLRGNPVGGRFHRIVGMTVQVRFVSVREKTQQLSPSVPLAQPGCAKWDTKTKPVP